MSDERARRVGHNEALYRLVNEQIEDVTEGFGVITGDLAVVCECGLLECQEQITLARSDYEEVRADPAKFVIKPGHQLEEFEDIVDSSDDYVVVTKKPGTPGRLANETDPRG